MKTRLLVVLLEFATIVASRPTRHIARRATASNSTNDVLTALTNANYSVLASFFDTYPTVLEQVLQSAGLKTLLAPTDEAMDGIPDWCTSNSTCHQNLMLMHFLNGSFYVNELRMDPLHTVGHSFLVNQDYVNLPGGNGQAIAMSLADASEEDAVTIDSSSVSLAQRGTLATTGRIDEASNSDPFIAIQPFQVANISVQPIARAMTIPGGPLETLRQLEYTSFVRLLEDQTDGLADLIDTMKGITIFAPTNRAFARYREESSSLTASEMSALLRNHLVASRAVYSPLLQDQGSMVTMAGQHIVFVESSMTLSLGGNNSANVTQLDIMHRGGVIHSIDTVLADTTMDSQTASQAAQSAANSAISNVAGPISVQNAASSQGTGVPAFASPIDGQVTYNSTVFISNVKDSDDSTIDSNNSQRNSAGNVAKRDLLTVCAALLPTALLLFIC